MNIFTDDYKSKWSETDKEYEKKIKDGYWMHSTYDDINEAKITARRLKNMYYKVWLAEYPNGVGVILVKN